jgi:hypothetical protein
MRLSLRRNGNGTDELALAHKSAHLATRVNRKPFTQDELQLVVLAVVMVVVRKSLKDSSVLRLCTIKPDDSKVMYTSAGDVQCSGEGDEGRSYAASYISPLFNVTHLPVVVEFRK